MVADGESQKRKYRSSFGATLLFSSVQIYQIIIRIIKSKFVALFIGPAGMGISSLLHSTTDLISASTNLGLKTSGVKTVAAANADNDKEKIAKTIIVLRRLILLTGLIGMLICALLAPVWSNVSFGNSGYTVSFVFVSLVILFEQLNNGELVLLQGTQQKKSLARANVIGQTISLILTIPLYYFFGIKAIVWVLVSSALITYLISKIYTSKLYLTHTYVSLKETFSFGMEMIKLGFFLSLQYLLQQFGVYIVRNYVSSTGGVDDVGLYSAGTSIITTYLGLVFSAIATDYFPRLAATRNNKEMKDVVHVQAEIFILLLAPLIVAFIVFAKPVIVMLYSNQFLPIENMLYWAIGGGTLLQAMGWAVSYTLLAKAKPSVFFMNEVVASCYTVPLRIIGYSTWGLTGFGIAMMIGYFIYLFQVLFMARRLFAFSYDVSMWKLFGIVNIPVIIVVGCKMYLSVSSWWMCIIGSLILVIFSSWVLHILNKELDLVSYISKKISRNGQ